MSAERRKLLIVEDDPGLLNQLKWCFEGFEVFVAEDRDSAITELRRNEPSVVLQDLGLPPKPDGVEEGLKTLQDILRRVEPQVMHKAQVIPDEARRAA